MYISHCLSFVNTEKAQSIEIIAAENKDRFVMRGQYPGGLAQYKDTTLPV